MFLDSEGVYRIVPSRFPGGVKRPRGHPREVANATAAFALPALAGVGTGVALFGRLDPVRFRRLVFALLLASGPVLLIRG